MAKAKKKWIQGAIKHPGALRATAKRKGLIKGQQKLNQSVINELISEGGVTAKRARLARTLKKF